MRRLWHWYRQLSISSCIMTSRKPPINSMRHGDAYLCQWTATSSALLMVCYLFGTKPLSHPMITNSLLRTDYKSAGGYLSKIFGDLSTNAGLPLNRPRKRWFITDNKNYRQAYLKMIMKMYNIWPRDLFYDMRPKAYMFSLLHFYVYLDVQRHEKHFSIQII